jgi:hypothetical protein
MNNDNMKNMKRLLTLLLVTTAIFFASCQKEVDPSIPRGREESVKKYLTRFVQYETAFPGQASLLLFEYDALKRVTKLTEQFVDTVAGVAQVTDETNYYFHYNGNETRPFKVTDLATGAALTWYLKYDAQGRKITDSVTEAGHTEVVHYSYGSNKIHAQFLIDVMGMTVSYKDTAEFTGDNVTRHTSAQRQNNSLISLYEEKYTFDDKPNPFNQLNIASSFFASAYVEFGTFLGLNKNNFLTVTQKDLVSPSDVWNGMYRYKYDADGYPTIIEFTEGPGPTQAGYIRYEYLP